MSILYVNEQGAKIGIEGGHFVVASKDGALRKMPKESLESITVFGNIVITSQCIRECLERGIAVNYFSTSGRYYGKLSSTRHSKAERVIKQVHAFEDAEFALRLAKKVIFAKVSNQLVVLKRYNRTANEEISENIKRIEQSKNKIEQCKAVDELMGYEGSVAREYFAALAKIVDEKFKFNGRNKQPPKDPFNSMLSLGYTILMYEIYNEIESRGLNPYIGFMHSDSNKHPTLASDLMEEWRAVIVDSVVMSLIQGHEIRVEHFYREEETQGVFLTSEGMKIFLRKLEMKLKNNANYLCSNEKASYFRRGIYLQTLALTRGIAERNIDIYEPVQIR